MLLLPNGGIDINIWLTGDRLDPELTEPVYLNRK